MTTFTAMADDALGSDDAVALRERLARGEVRASDLRAAALERARRANPAVNAVSSWIEVERPVDLEAPLGGIPSLVKDNVEVAGVPMTMGSRAMPMTPQVADGVWTAQFLAMGAVPIATTTLPEFGLTATTEAELFGPTRNPWDLDRSTGGSSGGSAALVAAGVVPIAHANDGGGSIRIPAAACGLVGLKSTRDRIVNRPEFARLPVNLPTQGVVSRSVRDTALYLATAERLRPAPGLPPIGHVTGPDAHRLRIGLLTHVVPDLPVDPLVAAAVDDAAGLLESLGHVVEPIEAAIDPRFGMDFVRYWSFLAYLMVSGGPRFFGPDFDRARVEPLTRGLARNFTRQLERMPASIRRLRRLAAVGEPWWARCDAVVSPVLGQVTPPIGYLGPELPFETQMVRLMRYTAFTPVANVTGSPAISLPLARTPHGLPIGIQVSAPRGHEARLLGLAYELEAARPWPLTPAAPSSDRRRE